MPLSDQHLQANSLCRQALLDHLWPAESRHDIPFVHIKWTGMTWRRSFVEAIAIGDEQGVGGHLALHQGNTGHLLWQMPQIWGCTLIGTIRQEVAAISDNGRALEPGGGACKGIEF